MSIDAIVDHILTELCYSHGFSMTEWSSTIDQYHASRDMQRANTEAKAILSNPYQDVVPQKSAIWDAFRAHSDARIGPEGCDAKELNYDEILALPEDETPPTPLDIVREGRLTEDQKKAREEDENSKVVSRRPWLRASPERQWPAITGHGIALDKIPTLEWLSLVEIAKARENGIHQPDMRNATNQDKRSAPRRADFLEHKGYIVTRRVDTKEGRTTLLTLKKFYKPPLDPSTLDPKLIASNLDPMPGFERWTRSGVDPEMMARSVVALVKAFETIRRPDLRTKMGVDGRHMHRHRKILERLIRALEEMGVLETKVSAGLVIHQGKTREVSDCVRCRRDLTEEELNMWRRNPASEAYFKRKGQHRKVQPKQMSGHHEKPSSGSNESDECEDDSQSCSDPGSDAKTSEVVKDPAAVKLLPAPAEHRRTRPDSARRLTRRALLLADEPVTSSDDLVRADDEDADMSNVGDKRSFQGDQQIGSPLTNIVLKESIPPSKVKSRALLPNSPQFSRSLNTSVQRTDVLESDRIEMMSSFSKHMTAPLNKTVAENKYEGDTQQEMSTFHRAIQIPNRLNRNIPLSNNDSDPVTYYNESLHDQHDRIGQDTAAIAISTNVEIIHAPYVVPVKPQRPRGRPRKTELKQPTGSVLKDATATQGFGDASRIASSMQHEEVAAPSKKRGRPRNVPAVTFTSHDQVMYKAGHPGNYLDLALPEYNRLVNHHVMRWICFKSAILKPLLKKIALDSRPLRVVDFADPSYSSAASSTHKKQNMDRGQEFGFPITTSTAPMKNTYRDDCNDTVTVPSNPQSSLVLSPQVIIPYEEKQQLAGDYTNSIDPSEVESLDADEEFVAQAMEDDALQKGFGDVDDITLPEIVHCVKVTKDGIFGNLYLSAQRDSVTFSFTRPTTAAFVMKLDDMVRPPNIKESRQSTGLSFVLRKDKQGTECHWFQFFRTPTVMSTIHLFVAEVASLIPSLPKEMSHVQTTSLGRPSTTGREKRFFCNLCGKSWRNSNGLEYHITKAQNPCNPSYVVSSVAVPKTKAILQKRKAVTEMSKDEDFTPKPHKKPRINKEKKSPRSIDTPVSTMPQLYAGDALTPSSTSTTSQTVKTFTQDSSTVDVAGVEPRTIPIPIEKMTIDWAGGKKPDAAQAKLHREIILELLTSNQGVFPGKRGIWYAFCRALYERDSSVKLQRFSICNLAVNSLAESGKIQKFEFSFRGIRNGQKTGGNMIRTVLALRGIEPSSPLVTETKDKIKEFAPDHYCPPEYALPQILKHKLDAMEGDFAVLGKHYKRDAAENAARAAKAAEEDQRALTAGDQSSAFVLNAPAYVSGLAGYRAKEREKRQSERLLELQASSNNSGKRAKAITNFDRSAMRQQFESDDDAPYDIDDDYEHYAYNDIGSGGNTAGQRAGMTTFSKTSANTHNKHDQYEAPWRKQDTAYLPAKDGSWSRETIALQYTYACTMDIPVSVQYIQSSVSYGWRLKPRFHGNPKVRRGSGRPPRADGRVDAGSKRKAVWETNSLRSVKYARSTYRNISSYAEFWSSTPLMSDHVVDEHDRQSIQIGLSGVEATSGKLAPQKVVEDQIAGTPATIQTEESMMRRHYRRRVPRVSQLVDLESVDNPEQQSLSIRTRYATALPGDLSLVPEIFTDSFEGAEMSMEHPSNISHRRDVPGALPLADELRLLFAVVVIRTLTGGINKVKDWILITALFPQYSLRYLQDSWSVVAAKHKAVLDKLVASFQDAYLEAYANEEVASIDYDNLVDYDWNSLVEWYQEKMEHTLGEVTHRLPPARDALHTQFCLKDETPPFDRDTFYEPAISVLKRMHTVAGIAYTIEVTDQSVVTGPVSLTQMDIAKSWVRASQMTAEHNFNSTSTKAKLDQLPPGVIEVALMELIRDKVLIQKNKGRPIPGRRYHVSDAFKNTLRRTLTEEHFCQATTFKSRLDIAFATGEEVEIPWLVNEGETLAITNLQAHHQISIVNKNLPGDQPNLPSADATSTGRAVNKELLRFGMVVQPTATYIHTKDNMALAAFNDGFHNPPLAYETAIPIWVDIDGRLIISMWRSALAALMSVVASRSGVPASELARILAPGLQEWEIKLLLGWCASIGVVETCRLGHIDGWTTGEWWWLILGNLNMMRLDGAGHMT